MHVEQLVGCQWNKRSDAVEYATGPLLSEEGLMEAIEKSGSTDWTVTAVA